MKLVRAAWKLLVGIKDALVLAFMLLFFGVLFAALSARPGPATLRDGALLIALDGPIVEQPERPDPFATLTSGSVTRQYRLRDLVRAIDAARGDSRVKAVVLDLDSFGGGYPATIAEVGAALGRVRASGKPVLAYATSYGDNGYLLAANASEVWVHPMGGALFDGPGGSRLYYKGLLDKLGVNAHVYRVGRFKAAVEPYTRADQSPEAREADEALYGGILDQWRALVERARPKARLGQFLAQPDVAIAATRGDLPKANLAAGIVDKIGDRVAFGKRVAQIAGAPANKAAGSFRTIKLNDWIAAHPLPRGGDAIGVVTVAGEIVDGTAQPGTAGGDTIAKLILDGLAKGDLKALVVRVDSPGGSVLGSERIRLAILEAKARGLPVVVSMGGLAASGGYWVSTPADTIFAEPNTVTGSIGIFGVLPTFENTLAKIGVTSDGVKTTPITGQPDVQQGTNAVTDRLLQAVIEDGYRRFIGLVAQSRRMTPARVDEIAQGRVWLGGTARQLGLVDRFGGLDDAIAEAARRAKLDPAKVHAKYLEKEVGAAEKLLTQLLQDDDEAGTDEQEARDPYSRIGQARRAVFAQMLGDARRLATGPALQARCLECAGLGPIQPGRADAKLIDLVLDRVFR